MQATLLLVIGIAIRDLAGTARLADVRFGTHFRTQIGPYDTSYKCQSETLGRGQ